MAKKPTPKKKGKSSAKAYKGGDFPSPETLANLSPVFHDLADRTGHPDRELRLMVNASDPDGDALTFSLVNPPVGANINPFSGAFTYTPIWNDNNKTIDILVEVTDSINPAVQGQFKVTVTNQGPTMDPIASRTGHPDKLIQFMVNATDPEGDSLTYTLVNGPGNMNQVTGEFTWMPAWADNDQSFNITVRATDPGGESVERSLTITVTNQGPALDPLANKTAHPDNLVQVWINGHDADGDPLTFSLVNGPGNVNQVTGEYTWTPTWADNDQSFIITVQVRDPGGLTAQRSFTVTVSNQGPTLYPIANRTVPVGQTLQLFANASDPDDPLSDLTFQLLAGPATAVINGATGELTWTPAAGDAGQSFPFTIRVRDPGGLTADRAFTITVP